MPSYEFTGLTEMVYPETRDAAGVPVGTVKPGVRRDFDAAPDHLWVPADGGEDSGAGTAEGAAPVPQPGQPVPPAVITGD